MSLNRNKLFLLPAFVVCFGLAACNKDRSTSDAPVAPTDPAPTTDSPQDKKQEVFDGFLNENNVKVEFVEGDYNLYELKISWPNGPQTVEISVNHGEPVRKNGSEFFSISVVEGSVNNISIKSFSVSGEVLSQLYFRKEAPKDFYLSEEMTLKDNLSLDVNRMILVGNARILTDGYNISVKTNKLIVMTNDRFGEGLLQTSQIVTADLNVAREVRQLVGSNISIKAKRAYGELRVGMIGFNGRDGRSGDVVDVMAGFFRGRPDTSRDGANGKDAVLEKACLPVHTGGCEETLVCTANATNGEDGKTGRNGTNGEDGWNGGNMGQLNIEITEGSKFRVEVYHRQGRPGKGGEGALGLPGGRGGKAGKAGNGAYCFSAKNGVQGAKGADGIRGKDAQEYGAFSQPQVSGVSYYKLEPLR